MLRLREVDKKIEELRGQISLYSSAEDGVFIVSHLRSLMTAYQKERIKALVRQVDDKENYEPLIPKGMYK